MILELTEKELEFLKQLLPQAAVTGESQEIVVELKRKVKELSDADKAERSV